MYQFAFRAIALDPAWVVEVVFSWIFFACITLIAILMHRRFRLYERAQFGDPSVQRMVLIHELALMALKLDLYFSLLIILEAGFFLFQVYSVMVEAFAFAVVCVWNALAYFALRREEAIPLRIVYGMSWMLPAYGLWKVIDVAARPDVASFAPVGQIAVLYVFFVVFRVFLVLVLRRVETGFGKRLRELLYGTGHEDDDQEHNERTAIAPPAPAADPESPVGAASIVDNSL